jgi:hypothetical protein
VVLDPLLEPRPGIQELLLSPEPSVGGHYGKKWGNGRTSDEGGAVMEGHHREALIGSCSSLNYLSRCSAASATCALL